MSNARKAAEAAPVPGDPAAKPRWVLGLSVVYALSGFCALIYQSVWIHQFSTVFGSTIFAGSVVISVFFGGMALGNLIFGRLSMRTTNPARLFALLQVNLPPHRLPRIEFFSVYDPLLSSKTDSG